MEKVKPLCIALLGYGRMGKEVEKAALARGHEVVCKIDTEKDFKTQAEAWQRADAAIEFSVPEAAANHIERCINMQKPVVVGTTAWQKEEPRLRALCEEKGGAVLSSANFSIGVNLFLQMIKLSADLCRNYEAQYKAYVKETHHVHKLDAPSGTALRMLDALKEGGWQAPVPIYSDRRGEIVGQHELWLESEVDSIEIRHEAKSRAGFALGAVLAAEWLVNCHAAKEPPAARLAERKGWYGMNDMLGF